MSDRPDPVPDETGTKRPATTTRRSSQGWSSLRHHQRLNRLDWRHDRWPANVVAVSNTGRAARRAAIGAIVQVTGLIVR